MLDSIATFANSYAQLPGHFFARQLPTPVARPQLRAINRPLAAELGLKLESLDDQALAEIFAGNRIPPGAVPLSMAYAGHQFGGFVPQLGDGRAILLGEVIDRSGARRDIQLKGAGRTPYSRRGDGRAALGPVLREYLLSEAMFALGIPATRALAAVSTGEYVFRERPLPGAVFTRVAASHVRVGTFQFFAARGDTGAVQILADHIIDRHYPLAKGTERPYVALLQLIAQAQAALVARWMAVGFVHGVMNTDNMAVSGETIDFGPCAFLEEYDPLAVFSSIDEMGRYAYGNQAQAAQWNLVRLAEALLQLFDPDHQRAIDLANEVLGGFPAHYEQAWLSAMRGKLGLAESEVEDPALIRDLLDLMHAGRVDFTLCFRRLADALEPGSPAGPGNLFADQGEFERWRAAWHQRLAREGRAPEAIARLMRQRNPAFIARNHRVEQALDAAIEREDFQPFETLLAVLAHPYEDQPEFAAYATPARDEERVTRTFCGT